LKNESSINPVRFFKTAESPVLTGFYRAIPVRIGLKTCPICETARTSHPSDCQSDRFHRPV